MNDSERITKQVFESLIPGTKLEYRSEQAHGEYDFDLRYQDGTTAALEVTASVDEILMGTLGAIRGRRPGGPFIQPQSCKKTWVIFPAKGACISRIREGADGLLARLEEEGIERFFCVSNSEMVREVCCQLQITGGGVISSKGLPIIRVGSPVGGGAVGPDLAIRAGEKEAWKEDNRKKLRAAKTSKRYCAVYFDGRNALPWNALIRFLPPKALPNIPDEVTKLWLVANGETKGEFVVWHAAKDQVWCSQRVNCTVM